MHDISIERFRGIRPVINPQIPRWVRVRLISLINTSTTSGGETITAVTLADPP